MNSKVHGDPSEPVRVAVVQSEPCWFDVEAGVKKTCNLIAEAAEGGAKLIAFPELWIPGYPNFIWAYTPKVISEYYIKYYRNAVDIESPHMDRIRAAARKAKLMVVISIAERDRGTLYMAQIFIGPDGGILSHRRKFKPTHFERVLFGDSSGDCTNNVVQTDLGRVGGLQCFEHLQPLLKYNTYSKGEQIHVAAWPNLFPPVGKMPFFNTVDSCTWASHVYAVEGSTFVLLASHVQTEKGLRAHGFLDGDDSSERSHTAVIGGGFSEIIAPDGRTLVKSPSASYDGLIYANLDFDEIYMAKNTVDPVGHYSRPDIFQLHVNDKVNTCVVSPSQPEQVAHASRYSELKDDPAQGIVDGVAGLE